MTISTDIIGKIWIKGYKKLVPSEKYFVITWTLQGFG
jgi:hypothetical protein